MLWAMSSLCFLGFLSSGEVTVPSDTAFDEATHITFNDVAANRLKEPTMVRARLKTSKTNPFRKGVDVVAGKTGDAIAQSLQCYITCW